MAAQPQIAIEPTPARAAVAELIRRARAAQAIYARYSQSQLDERVCAVLEKYGAPVLVERFISGREFHINMIDEASKPGVPRVLPLAEIAFEKTPGRWSVYTFTAKWDDSSDEYRTSPLKAPVEIPAADFARVKSIAERSYAALMCRDYARIGRRIIR